MIIIPSYCESLALPTLLSEMKNGLTGSDAVMVMDDSPLEVATEIDQLCRRMLGDSKINFLFDNHQGKSGRGAAIQRGMKKALDLFPELELVIECDADGSHRPEDILKLKNSNTSADLIIGSRYLPESKILGWPSSRRIFSYILNKAIPILLNLKLTDITNGLRGYSRNAVKEIIKTEQRNKGFIYLSEQALIVRNSGMIITETPITFINRVEGESTVSWREVLSSLRGIVGLLTRQHKI